MKRVEEAVKKELGGPGKLLGYRAMHKKIRINYNLNVSPERVNDMMYMLDSDGLAARGGVGKKKARRDGHFTFPGPNCMHSLDGHDKLMGYQNSTYPIAIYGSLDTTSRRLLWIRVWMSNSDPQLIGRWYLEYLMESNVMPRLLRIDRGSETGTMASIHAFLHRTRGQFADPVDSVIYGPSTTNLVK